MKSHVCCLLLAFLGGLEIIAAIGCESEVELGESEVELGESEVELGESEVELQETQHRVVNGTVSNARPEIGLIYPSGCTATLIHPRVVLTAHHCLDSSNPLVVPSGAKFVIDKNGTKYEYAVREIH